MVSRMHKWKNSFVGFKVNIIKRLKLFLSSISYNRRSLGMMDWELIKLIRSAQDIVNIAYTQSLINGAFRTLLTCASK